MGLVTTAERAALGYLTGGASEAAGGGGRKKRQSGDDSGLESIGGSPEGPNEGSGEAGPLSKDRARRRAAKRS
jgi:hypothetical protein